MLVKGFTNSYLPAKITQLNDKEVVERYRNRWKDKLDNQKEKTEKLYFLDNKYIRQKYNMEPKELNFDELAHKKVDATVQLGELHGGSRVEIKSEYGYAYEFARISEKYIDTLNSRTRDETALDRYEIKIDTDTIRKMEEKYQEIKKGIYRNFTGEEQKERLANLDKEFDIVFQHNIVKTTEERFREVESSLNENVRFFGEIKKTASEEFAFEKYSELRDNIVELKNQFAEIKEDMGSIHQKEGAFDLVLHKMEALNLNAKEVNERVNLFDKRVGGYAGHGGGNGISKELREIEDLLKRRSKLIFQAKKGSTYEERYKAFLQNAQKIKNIDQKLAEIIKQRNERLEKEEQAQKAKQPQTEQSQK